VRLLAKTLNPLARFAHFQDGGFHNSILQTDTCAIFLAIFCSLKPLTASLSVDLENPTLPRIKAHGSICHHRFPSIAFLRRQNQLGCSTSKAMQSTVNEGTENNSIMVNIDLVEAAQPPAISTTSSFLSRKIQQQEEGLTSPRSERAPGLESLIADRMLSPVLSRAREQHQIREAELESQRCSLSGACYS